MRGYLVKITDSAENSWVVDIITSKYILYVKTYDKNEHIFITKTKKRKKSII